MATLGVYYVAYRPVGWGGGACPSRTLTVLAHDDDEAETQALALWGIDSASVTPAEVARNIHGRQRKSETPDWPYFDKVWLQTGEIDYDSGGVPLMVAGGLKRLVVARDIVREGAFT